MHEQHTSVFGLLIGATLILCGPASAQQNFPTPEAAAQALVEAARRPGEDMLEKVLGPGAGDLLSSGNRDVDRERAENFLAAAGRGSSVVDGSNGQKMLVFGTNGWRFPIPLRSTNGTWGFDVAAGKQEILDRQIGSNEATAIGACADYVAAQKEYFATLHDDQPVQQYARKFISTTGLHDGLYWVPQTSTDRSPLGDRIAAAALEDVAAIGKPRPYHGYIYRILMRQGPAAPGGAYDYLVKERLLAGFALIAYPDRWQETGVMTFLCDQRGDVFQVNLGPNTGTIAAGITSFNPVEGWQRVGD